MRRRHQFVLLAAAVVAAMLPSPAAAATSTQVASGLDSPRGITFVNGRMLVAESGHGSTNASDCFFGGPGAGTVCIGPSGRISRPSTVYLAGCVAGRLGVMLDWLPAIVRLIAR